MNCRLKNSFGVSHAIVDQNIRSRSPETLTSENRVAHGLREHDSKPPVL